MGRWIALLLSAGLLGGCAPPGADPLPTTPAPATSAATTTPAAAPATPTGPAGCEFLPEGVDPRACDTPVAADPPVPESAEFPGLYVFSADDGRIRCDLNGSAGFVACAVATQLTPTPPGPECDAGDWDPDFVYLWNDAGVWAAGQGSCRGDPLTSELGEPPVLPEGAVVVDGDLAVLATPDGVVGWNGAERHGLAVLGDRVVTW
ncbi:MAG: hypothetical protein AAGC63_11435 [Propionicimonas sp.]|nr:hypothetical protein [Propionicimonas sp.]